jgi:hypothetical protein
MSKGPLLAAIVALLATSAMAAGTREQADSVPTPFELKEVIRRSWPSFSRLILQQDRLIDAPRQLTSLPQALCRRENLAGIYECAFLVEYRLSSGSQRSIILKSHFARDAQGRLGDVIFIRETPTPGSTDGVR